MATRFERARLVGARALQLAQGAPPLADAGAAALDPVGLALLEVDRGLLPLTVGRRP